MDRTVPRAIGTRAAALLAVVALAVTVFAISIVNRDDEQSSTDVRKTPSELLPESPITREEVSIRLASLTTPLESEAKALYSGLTRSVESVRNRIPERWRRPRAEADTEPAPSD